jgi:hypothetical protein
MYDRHMKNFLKISTFLIVLFISTASHAYFGVKLGGFTSGGTTNWGGGLVWGVHMPVKGLAIEADAAGYYNDGSTVNSFFLQTAVGPVLDFNPYITPDSDFFHPYVRAGLLYAFLFSQDDTVLSDQNGPGFFTGAGLNFNFPIVSIGVETNYNYVDFDTGSNDYWNYFISGGIHF